VRILLNSAFYPSVGGIETVAAILAHKWIKANQTVTIVTDVAMPDPVHQDFPFRICRRPAGLQLPILLHQHEIFVQLNVSLQTAWPLLLIRRPWVAVHQSWYATDLSENGAYKERFKLFCARQATVNIAASRAIANVLNIDCVVIPNPYDSGVFYLQNGGDRNKELIFVGRLVSDKGVDVLIRAVKCLHQRGLFSKVTIVGDGPERSKLEQLVVDLGLLSHVAFIGGKKPADVANLLNQHKILVVPSRWKEPFGIVALEGIACGCVVVGTSGGGLPDAIGKCGVLASNGNVTELVHAIEGLLLQPDQIAKLRTHADEHLSHHQPAAVANAYLAVMERAIRAKARS
jgi:glycogen(starch) synthase